MGPFVQDVCIFMSVAVSEKMALSVLACLSIYNLAGEKHHTVLEIHISLQDPV